MNRDSPIWVAPVFVWAILIALLALNVAIAFAPLGSVRVLLNVGFAAVQAMLIAVVLMRLSRATGLVRLAAASGWLWAAFLFILAGADYLTRA